MAEGADYTVKSIEPVAVGSDAFLRQPSRVISMACKIAAAHRPEIRPLDTTCCGEQVQHFRP
jgi:hypothetical protein